MKNVTLALDEATLDAGRALPAVGGKRGGLNQAAMPSKFPYFLTCVYIPEDGGLIIASRKDEFTIRRISNGGYPRDGKRFP